MELDASVGGAPAGCAEGPKDVKSDVTIVPRSEGSSLVAFLLEDGHGAMSCLLTQAQAEALSNELIKAVDTARFFDAIRRPGTAGQRLLA